MIKPYSVSAVITAQNVFSNWAQVSVKADLSISGVVDSTVTVQRTLDGGTTVKDVERFTAGVEKIIVGSGKEVLYRIGIKTGDYGTDTVSCSISG